MEAKGGKALVVLAVSGAMVFVSVLSIRPLASPDLGYHLDYAQKFINSRRIVDHDPLYTVPMGAAMPPGPGCWGNHRKPLGRDWKASLRRPL